MRYFKREIDKELEKWRLSSGHKPLILRGARQVGKTATARNLGKKFRYFLELNFEENEELCALFSKSTSVDDICENLSALYKVPIKDKETLLFLDEIQACPEAIQYLRFFYEKRPHLHIISAGSLLEFALRQVPTLGVGRLSSLFMYPMSFDEFLLAMEEEPILHKKKTASCRNPLPAPVHKRLLGLLKKFILVGGMPEAVAYYADKRDLSGVREILGDLITTYYDDFAKYKRRVPFLRLRNVFESVVSQMGKKFVYSRTHFSYRQVRDCLDLLILAGLVIPVEHSSANGLPLGAEANPAKFKLLVIDTGLYLQLLGLDIKDFLLPGTNWIVNRGEAAELFAGLEIIKYSFLHSIPKLYYWHREKRNSSAEVDYLLAQEGKIVPIEVKSGLRGRMKSLFIFLKEKTAEKEIRLSLENFSSYQKIDVYPLYAISSIVRKT